MLKIKPQLWTKNGGEQFVMLSLRDFEKVQEAIEDAGLSKILRQAKARNAGSAGISLAEMKQQLGMSHKPVRRPTTRNIKNGH